MSSQTPDTQATPDTTAGTPIDDSLQWGGMMGVHDTAQTPQMSQGETDAGLERTAELQAKMAEIRESTEHIVLEPHPEVEREDTVEKAHERGEL